MESHQSFPFEKNRYYYGKMLTTADFQAEQQYMEAKHCFINRTVLGEGILHGLSVDRMDEHSVLIESGVGLDGCGREVVIEHSIVRKLSAITGYEKLKSDKASLCLRYKEEPVCPLPVVSRQDGQEEIENNRIREGYEVFLQDAPESNTAGGESPFFQKQTLMETAEYEVCLQVPARVCAKTKVKLSVIVKKLSDGEQALSFSGDLQLPCFLTEDNRRELNISCEEISLGKGETGWFDYWVEVAGTKTADILWKTNSGKALLGGKTVEFGMKDKLCVQIVDCSPEELADWEFGRGHPREEKKEYITLAYIYTTDLDGQITVDHIEEIGVKKYISVPAQTVERRQYLSCFAKQIPAQIKCDDAKSKLPEDRKQQEEVEALPLVRGGVMEIPLHPHMKKGHVCFSEEIIHGLGPGDVYVAVGTGDNAGQAGRPDAGNSTVYGDNSLFVLKDKNSTSVQTAVKVFLDRGSFQVAVKLVGEQKTIVLILNWAAFRIPKKGGRIYTETEHAMIAPTMPTVRMKPGESYYFEIRFHHMEPCRLKYELLDQEGGVIRPDGVYTAPLKSGIYEIRITCEERKGIATYAYAIVGGEE